MTPPSTAGDVTALSAAALLVDVPAGANGAVLVTVGDAVKGPKFTYAAPITVTTNQAALTALAPVSETGLADRPLAGTNFTKATKILVGGKAVKVAKDGLALRTKITFAFPAGLDRCPGRHRRRLRRDLLRRLRDLRGQAGRPSPPPRAPRTSSRPRPSSSPVPTSTWSRA